MKITHSAISLRVCQLSTLTTIYQEANDFFRSLSLGRCKRYIFGKTLPVAVMRVFGHEYLGDRR